VGQAVDFVLDHAPPGAAAGAEAEGREAAPDREPRR